MSASALPQDGHSQEIFAQLKASCVPLLGEALLTPKSTPVALKHLTDLIQTLRTIRASGFTLTNSLISYVFYPVSTILRRNGPSTIPDRVLENIFVVLSLLCDAWWWDFDLAVWEQIFLLASAILGGLEGKGKERARDDETKDAAALCLLALLRDRRTLDAFPPTLDRVDAEFRLQEVLGRIQADKFIPVLGQMVDSLTVTSTSEHAPLRRSSLELLHLMVDVYLPDGFVPSVFPGIVSCMTRVALGQTRSNTKGWANGDTVAAALRVLESIVPRVIGDDVCSQEGAIRRASTLEGLVDLTTDGASSSKPTVSSGRPFITPRTPNWLQATTSQLHIAIKSLTPLVAHPTPSAPCAMCRFAEKVLLTTSLTLPQSRPLLLSFLLSASKSSFESVANAASDAFALLLASPAEIRTALTRTLAQTARDNLFALPRLLPTRSDAKVEHLAAQVEALCNLASSAISTSTDADLASISSQFGKLLGPTGGIEKWGWGLLSVLELDTPPTIITQFSAAQLTLENGPTEATESLMSWPEVTLRNVGTRSTYLALERMLWALGQAGGENYLFAVEWFFGVGRNGRGPRAVAALWCAARILDGVATVPLNMDHHVSPAGPALRSKRTAKLARYLAKALSELWDVEDETADEGLVHKPTGDEDDRLPVEFKKGLIKMDPSFDFTRPGASGPARPLSQPLLHKAICLRLLATTASILRSQFTSLLLHALYPILHSLVSTSSHLSSTALAALHSVTASTGYASPGNLLLSNFDYALDSVARRLTRRWLDVDATRVLAVLVRLVGRDVVRKAGDVVEECFDRLDEYHGYEVIVEGLVDVLVEVVQAIDIDEEALGSPEYDEPTFEEQRVKKDEWLDNLKEWYNHRHDPPPEEEKEDYGPAPKEPWGKGKEKDEFSAEGLAPSEEEAMRQAPQSDADPPPTLVQALTTQIVSRCIYFLTHPSALIRARILSLLSTSTPVLPPSALLPSVHKAWPFVLNRLDDPEGFVQAAAAGLIESLACAPRIGSFMTRRIWDDVWPRFHIMLSRLDAADAQSALAHRTTRMGVGTESAYTHSHRLYRALVRTMTGAFTGGVRVQDDPAWEVILAFRRFLATAAHPELQQCACDLYIAIGANNADAVWLALTGTMGTGEDGEPLPDVAFLREERWDIRVNAVSVIQRIDDART